MYFENKKDEYVEVLLPFLGITAGTYRLYLCVEDAAGNISFGDTAYTVSSDQPYLVQTLYNTVNYGNDKELWELFSIKT